MTFFVVVGGNEFGKNFEPSEKNRPKQFRELGANVRGYALG